MKYAEHQPLPALRPFVRCLWSLRGESTPGSSSPERVIPDGCPELILNRGERFVRHAGQTAKRQAETLLVGQLKQPILLASSGVVDLLAVRFEPSGMHALLGAPMQALCDLDTCLSQVSRSLHLRLDELRRSLPGDSLLMPLQVALLERLQARRQLGGRQAGQLRQALELLGHGTLGSEAVAQRLGTSRRTLERGFRRQVGLTPRTYLRIQRLQRVLAWLDDLPRPGGWAELALRAGYGDQAHMIRDFRQLAHTTPGRYLAEQQGLSACFISPGVSHSSNP